MTNTSKYLWPAAAITVGLLVAVTTRSTPPTVPAQAEAPAGAVVKSANGAAQAHVHQGMASPGAEGAAEPASPVISGNVLEVISVPNYTYLRIGDKGTPGVWAAVNSAEIAVGASVSVRDAQLMENFTSATLKRTFDKIYFGALGDKPAGGGAAGVPNGEMPQDDVHQGVAAGKSPHGDLPGSVASGGTENPHATAASADSEIAIGKIARAKGELGHNVSELYAQVDKLVGKAVRLRATVVKVTPNVMSQTFLHVRDGSGKKEKNDFDLTVTTKETPKLGDTVLLEGTLKKGVDFGAGYIYQVLLDGAKIVSE